MSFLDASFLDYFLHLELLVIQISCVSKRLTFGLSYLEFTHFLESLDQWLLGFFLSLNLRIIQPLFLKKRKWHYKLVVTPPSGIPVMYMSYNLKLSHSSWMFYFTCFSPFSSSRFTLGSFYWSFFEVTAYLGRSQLSMSPLKTFHNSCKVVWILEFPF